MSHPIALVSLMRGMCTMNHGMGSINEELYEKVKDSVRLSTPVQKIVIDDKKVKGVETKDGFLEADQVICATDAFIAQKIMPDLPDTIRKPLETCKYSSTFMYEFSLDKKITPKHFFVMMLPGTTDPLVAICDAAHDTATTPPDSSLILSLTAGWHDESLCKLSEEDRRRLVIRETKKYLPEFPDEPPRTEVFRHDRAINLESPGQFNAIHDLQKNRMREVKGLYLAGEYLFLIASTEGAYATGEKAAHMVIEDL